ncbi:glycosyl hydrolase family 32 [Nocardia pseudobrasiliensis]|uniref:glycosyl hydrolase family 32 n=1 Tax=Nocardia pseudobrasiliensis TaxID=45979 RepID=UPI001FE7EE02|nr:glycosyl hydrolase family 32 [Nocardia pseudobrasiliensis]
MRVLVAAALVAVGICVCDSPAVANIVPERVSSGAFDRVYDPSDELRNWYVNDHSFVFDESDATWHLFGITHTEFAAPYGETTIGHATAKQLGGPWTTQPPVLRADPAYGRPYGETHLWAPHIVSEGGVYYMFYSGGAPLGSRSAISLATSTDLVNWTRDPDGPLFRDGWDARDPMVTRVGDQWVVYYTATSTPVGGSHIVAYRTSADLRHWSERRTAFTDPGPVGFGGGPTESPFVVQHGNLWYLFIGPRGGYVGTDIFYSDNPWHFDNSARAGHIDAHAAEVVADGDRYLVSSAGWGQGGLSLAPLVWHTA